MRIDENLTNLFISEGFKQTNFIRKGTMLFLREQNLRADAILLFYSIYGSEMPTEEYSRLFAGLRKQLYDAGYLEVGILGIVLTDFPEKARRYCINGEDNWIIDLAARRLIIYENQIQDYSGLRDGIENLLTDISVDTYIKNIPSPARLMKHGAADRNKNRQGYRWISLCNTLLIIANIIIFILVEAAPFSGNKEAMQMAGALSWVSIKEDKEYYRLMTNMFMHWDIEHLFNNMMVLFFVGDNLERAAGKLKFLIIYFGSGIIAGIASISYNMIKEINAVSAGASGAIFGVVGAMLYIIILNKGRLEDISGAQLIMFAVVSLYGGIISVDTDNAAHIGGLIAGIILAVLLYRKKKNISAPL